MGKKWITKPGDVPNQPHYAIFAANSVYVPGDDRSRQHPGHGYPASTEHFLSYIVFDTKEEWEADIQSRVERKSSTAFTAVHVIPAQIEQKVVVNITTPAAAHVYTKRCPKCGEEAESIFRDGIATRECRNGHRWIPAEDKQ